MKKAIAIALAIMLIATSLVGCNSKTPGTDSGKDTGKDTGKSKGYEIALITDKGNIDDKSFNQGSWEGVVEFAEKENISHTYIKPEEASDAGYLAAIDLAVQGGAKVIVTPGFLFEVPVHEAQTKYPEVKFILLDGAPHEADSFDPDIKENVASILYAEEQSGYLAGYAAVKDGMTHLGFMGGMAVPAVQAFGYGYLQGAEDAAEELGLEDGAIKAIYHYTGDFEENDTNKSTAKAMYQEGAEVIFGCGGAVGKSVMSAASEANAKFIGVDVDQRYDSETTITSATKGLAASVISVLEAIYKTESWADFGGKSTVFDAKNDGVGLPTTVIGDEKADAFDRFKSFDKAQYEELFGRLKGGEIEVKRSIEVKDPSGNATADELTSQLDLKKVTVTTR
ncbi:BMP family lipoprotein [Wansuia hejianensis]|uniref:BMP family ABC transporter substrate-binding protein n=1 Tax=Wansuia hejianensis TaxID=2763667 RepID=A0A926F3Y6_9FIRM|nr:BMP family ABC transporter substrate-binding protein [Wansuia hejianensis]MBC8591454.1 BMP family ABC transporter substrate-binding protein [Wansuia hejianensis]